MSIEMDIFIQYHPDSDDIYLVMIFLSSDDTLYPDIFIHYHPDSDIYLPSSGDNRWSDFFSLVYKKKTVQTQSFHLRE